MFKRHIISPQKSQCRSDYLLPIPLKSNSLMEEDDSSKLSQIKTPHKDLAVYLQDERNTQMSIINPQRPEKTQKYWSPPHCAERKSKICSKRDVAKNEKKCKKLDFYQANRQKQNFMFGVKMERGEENNSTEHYLGNQQRVREKEKRILDQVNGKDNRVPEITKINLKLSRFEHQYSELLTGIYHEKQTSSIKQVDEKVKRGLTHRSMSEIHEKIATSDFQLKIKRLKYEAQKTRQRGIRATKIPETQRNETNNSRMLQDRERETLKLQQFLRVKETKEAYHQNYIDRLQKQVSQYKKAIQTVCSSLQKQMGEKINLTMDSLPILLEKMVELSQNKHSQQLDEIRNQKQANQRQLLADIAILINMNKQIKQNLDNQCISLYQEINLKSKQIDTLKNYIRKIDHKLNNQQRDFKELQKLSNASISTLKHQLDLSIKNKNLIEQSYLEIAEIFGLQTITKKNSNNFNTQKFFSQYHICLLHTINDFREDMETLVTQLNLHKSQKAHKQNQDKKIGELMAKNEQTVRIVNEMKRIIDEQNQDLIAMWVKLIQKRLGDGIAELQDT